MLTSLDVADQPGLVENTPDKSYVYAAELLNAGMPVVYMNIGITDDSVSCVKTLYDKLFGDEDTDGLIYQLEDRNEYSVKYITCGGYPTVFSNNNHSYADSLINVAATRGDAVALIDYKLTITDDIFSKDVDSVYKSMETALSGHNYGEYGAAMYPWGLYGCSVSLSNTEEITNKVVEMPGSFAYLMCVAKAIKTSPNWLAMAGVTRGIVPNLQGLLTKSVLTNTVAEECQPKFGSEGHSISINCITNIRPYGLTLWGNRTLKPVDKEGPVALNFLNTRNMISDIKKLLYTTAKSLMFEQNSDSLWLRFKSGITPLLNQLKTGNGISDYRIIKGETKYDGNPLQKGEMAATIKIFPIHAIEYFELTVEISDDDVTVS